MFRTLQMFQHINSILYTLEASLFFAFFTHIHKHTEEERRRGRRGKRQTLSAITFCALKTNRTNHMSILSTTHKAHILFLQEALRIIIYSGQQRNERQKTQYLRIKNHKIPRAIACTAPQEQRLPSEHKMHEWMARESTREDRFVCVSVKTRKGKKTLVCLIKSS